MNRLNDLLRTICSVLCGTMLICATGCVDKSDIGPADDDTVAVTLRADQLFQEKAYIRLNHTGSQDDFWYSMLTDDLVSDAEMLIREKIAQALEAEGELVCNVGTNKSICFEGLEPKTSYRVIASRVTISGEPVGNVAELVFETQRDPAVFEVYPAWKIDYKERRVAANDPNLETEIFECSVSDTTAGETYIPCLLTKKDFAASYDSDIRRCFEDYIAYRNTLNVKWKNEVRKASSEFVQDRLRHDDYVLFMIGVDTLGALTGYYSKMEYTLKQETATDAYKAWLGTWKLTGTTEKGTSVEYEVDIVSEENNLYYRMYGYETHTQDGLADVPELMPLSLYFEKSSGDAYVISESFEDMQNEALAAFYDFYAYGCVEVLYGDTLTIIPIDITNLRIARFHLGEDGATATAHPTSISIDIYDKHYDTEFISFNYFYISALGEFNYVLKSADLVARTSTLKFTRN